MTCLTANIFTCRMIIKWLQVLFIVVLFSFDDGYWWIVPNDITAFCRRHPSPTTVSSTGHAVKDLSFQFSDSHLLDFFFRAVHRPDTKQFPGRGIPVEYRFSLVQRCKHHKQMRLRFQYFSKAIYSKMLLLGRQRIEIHKVLAKTYCKSMLESNSRAHQQSDLP